MNDDDDDDAFVDAASESSEDDERAFADAASPAELFPLHCAAFANDVKRIRELLASVDDIDANALDGAGHTALHVAALRMAIGAVKTLCADARVDVNATSARGWSALRLAIHSRTRACARAILIERERRRKATVEASAPALMEAISRMPDFELACGWRFGSRALAPLIKMCVPRDEYAISAVGGKLRVDGELRGVDAERSAKTLMPRWHRGKFSLIIDRGGGSEAKIWFVDHVKREVFNALERPDDGGGGGKGDDAGDFPAVPLTEEQKIELELDAMFLDGAGKRKVKTEGFTFVPARGWMSRRAVAWVKGRKTEVWDASAKVIREKLMPGGGYKLDGSFEEYIESASAARDNIVRVKPVGGAFHGDDDDDDDDPSGLNAYRDTTKQKKPPKTRNVSARCWLVRDFPLSVRHLSSILDVLSHANKSAKHVNRAVKYWCDNHDELFPVKIQVPLMFTIYAQLQFKDYKALTAVERDEKIASGFFDIPSDYARRSIDDVMTELDEKMMRDIDLLEEAAANIESDASDDDDETVEMKKMRDELQRVMRRGDGADFADDCEDDDDYQDDDDDDDGE